MAYGVMYTLVEGNNSIPRDNFVALFYEFGGGISGYDVALRWSAAGRV